MRNLKRVLSLALASAMLLGMMVMGAGAADAKKTAISDMDKVTNKVAVNLMVDLGIIVGKPDGTFAPAEAVNRSTMAKLITYIMMGDVDASLFNGTTTDLKDIKGDWAEGYIKYCYANKIITGDGLGSFFPAKGVTVVEAAKMLLVAIGYDAATQGYVGGSWSVNIVRDAKLSGLLNGVTAKSSDALTRDDAALMIFNSMFAKTVTYETQYDGGKPYLVNPTNVGNKTLGQLQYDLGKIEALVTGINTDGTAITSTSGDYTTLNGIITGKLAASPELVGGKVVAYYNTNTNKLISTALTAGASSVLATTNAGISNMVNATNRTHKDFKAELEAALTGNSQPATVTYFVNGDSTDDNNTPYGINGSDAAAGGTTGTGTANTTTAVTSIVKNAGCIVDFVDTNDNGKADVVRITNKTVATLTADPSTKDVTNNDTQVKVPGVINAFSSTDTVKTVKGYTDLKKGDVVLFVRIGNMTYIEKAAMIEGVVKGTNKDNKLNVDGTYYGTSGLRNANNGWVAADFLNTYKFYLDNSKNIIKAEKVTDQTTGSYVAVLKTSWVAGTGAIGESNYAQGQVLLPDGTTEVVVISKIDGATPVAVGTIVGYDSVSGAGDTAVSATEGAIVTAYLTAGDSTTAVQFIGVGSIGTNLTDEFYTYTKNTKGAYSLTSVATANVIGDGKAITNGKAAITDGASSPATKAIANANTVFLLKSGTAAAPVYTSYTGIANVPSMTGATMTIVVKDGVAAYVYVSATGTLTGTVGEYFFVPASIDGSIAYNNVPTTDGTGIAYKEINAIVNGEATTIKVDPTVVLVDKGTNGAFDAGKIEANVMYTVAGKNVDGIIATVGDTASATKTGVSVSGGTMIVGTTVAYTVDADTAIFYIGTDGTVSTLDFASVTADKTDKVIVIDANNDNKAETVYIMQAVSATATASSIKYSLNGAPAVAAGSSSGTVAVTPAKATEGHSAVITEVTVADGATYVVSGNAVVQNNGTAAAAANTITITVTAEDGIATSVITLTFVAAAT